MQVSVCAPGPGERGERPGLSRAGGRAAGADESVRPALSRLFGRVGLCLRRVHSDVWAFGRSPLALVPNYIQNSIENIKYSHATCFPSGATPRRGSP